MPATDRVGRSGPFTDIQAVTPDDNADLPGGVTRGLYVGVTGAVVVIPGDGGPSVTLTGVAAGVWHPIGVRRVLSTGTTATDIVVGR